MISRHTSCLSSKAIRLRYLHHRIPKSAFSTTSRCGGYEDTIQNLKIGSHTRVIFQGFTGKQATANAQESIAWGTKVVGGTNPKKDGQEHLGLPVVGTVRKAMEQLKPDATGIYVAAPQAAAAIEEAIEAEVPLIVAVAEHIPIHDLMRVSKLGARLRAMLNQSRYTPCCSPSPSQDLLAQMHRASSRLSDGVESVSNLYPPSRPGTLVS